MENLENKVRVITYSDDNHDIRVFVNGRYIGELSDPRIAVDLLRLGTEFKEVPVLKDVYIFDLPEDKVDDIHDLLSNAQYLTIEEEKEIFELDI